MRKVWPLIVLLPLALLAQGAPPSQPVMLDLPGPCPEKGPCLAPEDWRLAWLSSAKERLWVVYDVSAEHLRAEQKARYAKTVTLFLQNGESLLATGGRTEPAGYGCGGKQPRLAFATATLPEGFGRGSWALLYAGEQPLPSPGIDRSIGRRVKPEAFPEGLRAGLRAWSLPAWADGAAAVDAVLPIQLDADPEPEYWVTRTYTRAEHEDPAKRMFSSWAIFDLTDVGGERRVTKLAEMPEDECDCLCRDGGCGCCRWDEVTTSPQALFDADGDGFAEVVLERHRRVGMYRYELWRFDGKRFTQTSLFF